MPDDTPADRTIPFPAESPVTTVPDEDERDEDTDTDEEEDEDTDEGDS